MFTLLFIFAIVDLLNLSYFLFKTVADDPDGAKGREVGEYPHTQQEVALGLLGVDNAHGHILGEEA